MFIGAFLELSHDARSLRASIWHARHARIVTQAVFIPLELPKNECNQTTGTMLLSTVFTIVKPQSTCEALVFRELLSFDPSFKGM